MPGSASPCQAITVSAQIDNQSTCIIPRKRLNGILSKRQNLASPLPLSSQGV